MKKVKLSAGVYLESKGKKYNPHDEILVEDDVAKALLNGNSAIEIIETEKEEIKDANINKKGNNSGQG